MAKKNAQAVEATDNPTVDQSTTAEAQAAKPEAKITTVTLTDGRIIEFVGKRQILKEAVEVDGKPGVRVDFINGETRTYLIPPQHMTKSATHGYSQKLGDEVAGEKDVGDAMNAMDALHARLESSQDWNQKREGGDSFSGSSVVIKAMCEVTGKTKDEIVAYLEGKLAAANAESKAKGEKDVLSRQALYKAIRGNPKFADTIAKLEAAAAKPGPEVAFDDI